MKTRWFLIAFLLLILFVAASCGKLTMDNYNKIKVGMTYNEVTTILGSPDNCNDIIGMRSCVWGDDKKSITVSFVGDKVLLFSANNIR
jgi:hypothetical protein